MLGAFFGALSAYATFAWLSAYEASPIVRGLGAFAAIRRFAFNVDLVIVAAACAIASACALVPRRRREAHGATRVLATAWRLDGADVARAAALLALAASLPMPLLAWSMPAWFAIAGPATGTTLVVATLATIASVVAAIARPSVATIGADGVLVERRGARPRFVPFARVARVAIGRGSLDLALEGGGHVRLYVPRDVAARVVAFIADALRDRGSIEAPLARGDRGVARWIDAVRSAAPPSADYRTSQLPAERLWGVLDDPRACPTVRAAAACALAPTLDDAGRARMRVAGDRSANPALRDVVRVACESADDEDAIAEALARV